jgi:hypothetical protein
LLAASAAGGAIEMMAAIATASTAATQRDQWALRGDLLVIHK